MAKATAPEVLDDSDSGISINLKLMEWRDKNPLYMWRTRNKISRLKMSALLGVTDSIISRWEQGTVTPREEKRKVIARIIGVNERELNKTWVAWKKERPK